MKIRGFVWLDETNCYLNGILQLKFISWGKVICGYFCVGIFNRDAWQMLEMLPLDLQWLDLH